MTTPKRKASKTTGIAWCSIPHRKGYTRLPDWMRAVGLGQNGDVWVSAGLAGNELMVVAIGPDLVVQAEGHLYVKSVWMRRQFPALTEGLDSIEQRTRDWAERGFPS